MIDFEQEIETRLATFQHLNGKGNVKDCNRQLYEIVRLMLGMIHQNSNAMMMPFTSQFTRAEAPDASPSREAPNGYEIHIPASTALPEPLMTASDYEDDVADDDEELYDDEVIDITPEALELSASPKTIDPKPDAPYGYTKNGHPRLTPQVAKYGYTESGLPRKTPLRGK